MSGKLTGFAVSPAAGYAGDVSAETAWKILESDPTARLIDVRTTAEWNFVGLPDVSAVAHKPILLEWQSFPTMTVDAEFAAHLRQQLGSSHGPLLFLCRSGARSASAARAVTAAGFGPCLNVADGFEGPLDGDRHRGAARGWKAAGLPWVQS